MRELVDLEEPVDDVDDEPDYFDEISGAVHASAWSRQPGEEFLRCAEHGLRVDEH